MTDVAKVIGFTDRETEVEEYYLDAEKLLIGNPKQSLWNHYTDPTGQFFTGEWSSEAGKWKVSYAEEEYCQILQGVSVITDAEGDERTVRAGDSFVVPRGFEGTWEVVAETRKIYVIYEANS
ncbi:MAG: cupin domain-containing protein [Pseudomonadales bacterium]